MVLKNTRTQHAVGQGFFHSAELWEENELLLRYIYDCGSASKFSKARSDRIKEYLNSAGACSPLDLLFISHVHADHLNGLPQLLHPKTGLAVDTIVLPYFDVIDRLIAYARDATEDPAALPNDFYRGFVVDPVVALSSFRPRQIIFVLTAGGDGPGAPGLDGVPREPGPDAARLRAKEKGLAWKLVGRGVFEPGDGENAPSSGPTVTRITDSVGFAVPSTGTGFWLLSPFIDPAIARQRVTFKAALLNALNRGKMRKDQIKKAAFDVWLRDSVNRQDLVVNRVSDLREAYRVVEKNLNISSMCLYSGPLTDDTAPKQAKYCRFGKWTAGGGSKIGWLATGDADLKEKKRRDAFLRHYRKLLDHVVTLILPHHGSEGNFDVELLTRVDPAFCVAAADMVGKWRHPGSVVVQAIASHGRFLSVVTSKKLSEVTEEVWLG